MNLIIYISVVLSAVSVSFTYLNIVIANSATIHAIMETHEVEHGVIEFCPGNKFGEEHFVPPYSNGTSSYLNLIVVNDGPGVAKKIEWKIEKIGKDGVSVPPESNRLPYIGKGARVIVKGYLEVVWLAGKENEFSYKVTITFNPFLYGRKRRICQQFNAFGELQKSNLR